MSFPTRGRGSSRPLYVAPSRRTGAATSHVAPIAPTAALVHTTSPQKDLPRDVAGATGATTNALGGTPSQNSHRQSSCDPPQQLGIACHKASKISPVVSVAPVMHAAEAAPSHPNSLAPPSSMKNSQAFHSQVKASGKGQASRPRSNSSIMGSIPVTDAVSATVGAPVSTLTDPVHTVVSACMCLSSGFSSNADKALALKDLDSNIRSSSLAALIPSFPPDIVSSLTVSLPSLVFSGSAGIRALALAVCDGLGNQNCPGWNPDVFLQNCFRFLQASDLSNMQFLVQCLCFLISKCSSNWIEPNLTPCMLHLLQLADNLDNAQKLMQLIRIFSVTASKYPAMFKRHMKSVLKMLLGWCLDASIGLDASLELSNAIIDFGPVLCLEPALIQAAIKKIDVDLERACVLRSVDFRVPVLTQLLCKFHECSIGLIDATECMRRFSVVLSSLALCIDKCGIVGQRIICSTLASLWRKTGLNQSKMSARTLALWLLCWENETEEINEDQLSLIVNGCIDRDSSEISNVLLVDRKSFQPSLSFCMNTQILLRTQRFFTTKSVWLLQCIHKGSAGQLMRTLLLHIANSHLSLWSCLQWRSQFLENFVELADIGNNIVLSQSRIASLQALLFPSTAFSASPSALLIGLLSSPPLYARISFLLLNNIVNAMPTTNDLQSIDIVGSCSDSFQDVHASVSLSILLRDSEMHPDVEIHRVVTDTLSLMVYTIASTLSSVQVSTSSDAAIAIVSSLLQCVDDHVANSAAMDSFNSADRRLSDDEMVDALSQANLSQFIRKGLTIPHSVERFHARAFDHSMASALLLLLEHPFFCRMSIGSLDAILLLLFQCCDSFGGVAAAAVSKHMLYLGILHCVGTNFKVANHVDVVARSSRYALLRRIFAAVGNMSSINGEGCSNKMSFASEPTPVTLISCMWTLSSFSFCDLSPNEVAILFCDALMYASFSFEIKDVNVFSSAIERSNHEVSGESQCISALSSDQLKIFMTFLSQSPEISSSVSFRRADEITSKIPCLLHTLSRVPSPREILSDLSNYMRTFDNLSFSAASAIINSRFRGSWGSAKEFFDWLTFVSQCRGYSLYLNVQRQLISSLVCAIQRLSCAVSKPVFSPQGVPLDNNNLYFSQNYRTIENHCHRARSGILEQHQSLSPFEFHEHFKERLKFIVRSAAAALEKKNASAATTVHSQFQIASRSSTSTTLSTFSPIELAMQELETLVISAAHCSLRLMSPDFSNCLMFAARSTAARIAGVGDNSFGWTQVVSLMCLGSYETAFDTSIHLLQLSCSVSLRNLLIDCACTCVTRLLNDSLFSKLESTLTEEERSNSSSFAVAGAACSALSSWDTSFGVLQGMRVRNADIFDRPSAVSGFSLGIMSCMTSSVVSPSSAAKEISNLSVAISVSLASMPNIDLAVTASAMSDMALLNMIDSRQMPQNFGLFSHKNLWAMPLGQSMLLSRGVEQKPSSMTATLQFVKTLRKNGCFTSAIHFMENMKLLVTTRPEFLIEHFQCITAIGGNSVIGTVISMLSLVSELRNYRSELSAKAALCINYHLSLCDRSTLSECSKLTRQEPCILLSDTIRSSSYISHSQKFLLNSIATSVSDFDSTFENPLPSSFDASRSLCKYLTNLWILLGSAAFRITASIFHSSANSNPQDDEHLLKFIGTEMPDFSKLSDREIMAAAVFAQNIWIEQVGKRYYHAIQPRSASEVDACLRLAADKSVRGDVLSLSSLDLIFYCWKKIYSHQQQLSSLATKSFLASLRCNVAKESTLLDVVLRLLRIIGCYSAGLDHVLQDGLSTSPTACWVRALPQLVAQLSHVSDRIAAFAGSLLSNIAREYPNRVLYTAVCSVGLDAADPVTSSREWQVVLKELEKQQPHAVASIRKMASELLLISVLPEEKLLASVAEIVSQLPVKIQQYTKEVERVTAIGNATSDMQSQRYLTVFRPLLISLESTLQTFVSDCSSTVSVSSSHQVWLNRNILPPLRSAVESASTPIILSDISEKWKPLRSVGQKVQELIRRRASIDLFSMSTTLSGNFFACNRLPMPPTTSDASGNDSDAVISGIESCILVMRTKTLPKKIVFKSSTGSSKTFLLKGREDLNLDERMMQFVDVANLFFKDILPAHSRDCVKARKYCVTPLSKRAGLIEWINNCSSLMQLYEAGVSVRAAAEFEAVASSEQKKHSDARHTAPFKPVDHYTQHLQKALADVGVNFKSVPRNLWPREVMLKLYRQMAESAPRSIFHDALWSSSSSSLQWWTRHVTFSRSLAVSSMIGYVIGLGDRHLDNILLDLRDGSVLHIDWNVCFEKGLRLAVPETVPFRLTPGLQYALGPGGAEGVFSNVATQCMEVLRDNRDILMTLLETFVHDPLLDWATALRTRRKRNALEVCVNFSLLAARLDELLDAAQINQLPNVSRIVGSEVDVAEVVAVGDIQRSPKQVHDSQADVSSARYVVSATATEVCLRQCRFLALKNLAGSYSARLVPEKSKATARLCKQDFMRLVIAEEMKIAAFSEFLISLHQPSTTQLIDDCLNMSRPSFSAHAPSQSSWRIKKGNESIKPVTEAEWIRLVGLAHQNYSNLDSAIKELRDLLLKYIDIVAPFSPGAYASMTFSGEWSRLGRAVVSDQDNLDGRSAIMVFSSFTCNSLLQARKEVMSCLETFHQQMILASDQASCYSKALEQASNLHERVSLPPHEVFDVFNSWQEVIETHPFEALSTTVSFLKQSIEESCQNIPLLSDCSFDSNIGRCEWLCVVQKLYVPVILTWLAVDSNSALAYLLNQPSMPLPYPCCTFCYGLQKSSLSEVIRDEALCDAALLVCKAWNIVSSSWLCLVSLSSQLAQQFSSQAVAAPEIEKLAAAISVFAKTEISHDSWLSFLRTRSENAIASAQFIQTVSAIYGWCTPLIDWFIGLRQPECFRTWLTCLVDVLSQMFSHTGAQAFAFRAHFVEKAFNTWSLKWIRLLFHDHNLFSRLSSLQVAQVEISDQRSDICHAIASDLNHRVNVSCDLLYQIRKTDMENNLKQQQQLFKQFLWTHAPIIQMKYMKYCPAEMQDVEFRLPLSVHNAQACLGSFLSAHTNITSREDSLAHSHSGKQPEVVQRRAIVDKIKGNAMALIDVCKKIIELEQQRCHCHTSLNWFGTSPGTVPLNVSQFLNSLASWEAASVFASGGVAKVQEACDITSRALAVSEEAASSAISDMTASEEAAARAADIKSALQRADPILSSLLRLLAHPAADLLLPSDIASHLKQLIHEIVERDVRGDDVNSVLKKLCLTQQAVSKAAVSLNDKDDVDEVQPSNEGASLAVKALRRIQKKLSGRDSVDSGLDAKAQVERAIDSATNVHLLSRMYEGWTPWI